MVRLVELYPNLDVVDVDIDKEQMRKTKIKNKADFIVADYTYLPFKESFDIITCIRP